MLTINQDRKPAVRQLWFVLSLLVAGFLAACSDESNLDQPAELKPFKSNYYLDVAWLASTGAGVDEQFLKLKPLVLEQRVVTVSHDGVINIIDKQSGEFEQDIELDAMISAGVGGDESLWLVATRDAYVMAVDAKTRTVSWRTRVSSEVLATPAIYQNTVLVRAVDGKILSLDKYTGKIRWQYERAIPDLTLRGSSDLVISRGRIIAGLADGRLIALSPDTGEVIWDVALAVPSGSSEIQRLVDIDGHSELYGRVLYSASYQGRLAAIDVERGQFLWARDFSTYTGVSVDEKTLYSTDDNGFIWALDRYNGATVWKQSKLAHRAATRPTIIGDYIAVGDFEGYIHLMSKFDGHFVARYQLGQFDKLGWELASGIIVPPIVFNDSMLLVIARGGIGYVLKLHERDHDF